MSKLMRTVWMIVLFCLYIQDLKGQCSMCKAIAEEEVEEEGATGINAGILYMMAIPYIIVMIIFRKNIISFIKGLRKPSEKKRA